MEQKSEFRCLNQLTPFNFYVLFSNTFLSSLNSRAYTSLLTLFCAWVDTVRALIGHLSGLKQYINLNGHFEPLEAVLGYLRTNEQGPLIACANILGCVRYYILLHLPNLCLH